MIDQHHGGLGFGLGLLGGLRVGLILLGLRFGFRLLGGPDGLEMRFVRWSLSGLSLPLWLAPRITAREWEETGRFRFEVAVAMPMVGEVVRYSGSLTSID